MRVPGCPLIIDVSEGGGSGARVTLPGPVPLHQPASLTLHHPSATLDQIEVNVEGMVYTSILPCIWFNHYSLVLTV